MVSITNLTEWLMIIVIFITMVISIKYGNKKNLLLVQLYIIFSLVFNVLFKVLEYFFDSDFSNRYISMLMKIYSIIEISLICLFLIRLVNRKKSKTVIKTLYIFYISIWSIIFVFFKNALFFNFSPMYGLENLFIVIACMLYIFEIVRSDEIIDLKSNSNFIAVSGIFFYFSISIPYFFIAYSATRLGLIQIFSLLNLVFYILLFISLLKAYLCPLQKSRN